MLSLNKSYNSKISIPIPQLQSTPKIRIDTGTIKRETAIVELTQKNEIEYLLPPMLKNLTIQNKFITIIGSPRKLDRFWFEKNHLPLTQFIQINTGRPSVQTMRLTLGALSSGKSSAVITWLPDISGVQLKQLLQAAIHGDSKAILLPFFDNYQ